MSAALTKVPDIEFPEKLQVLFQPKRYKILYGGRGGAKSWGVARALLLLGTARPMRIGCFREIQKSIKESVHALLKTQIEQLGLGWFYQVQETKIVGRNGTEFVFAGLRTLSVENIKSYEGLDVAWVEEARNVSKRSWDVLIPTIRKDGSEIWATFNPELDTDETYIRFVVGGVNDNDVALVDINWRDNPWFPKVLEIERRKLQERDPDSYMTVYEGKCRAYLDGAIYATELRAAIEQKRITRVPYEPSRPVHTFWDLGYRDMTAIWLVQFVGLEKRIIGYIEDSGQALDYFLQELQKRKYLWGVDYLPHDAGSKSLQTGKSIKDLMIDAGRDVLVLPQMPLVNGIQAARQVFSSCWFDQDECRIGLNRLKSYVYEVDDEGQKSRFPLHDENSHGADAFRYFAMSCENARDEAPMGMTRRPIYRPPGGIP